MTNENPQEQEISRGLRENSDHLRNSLEEEAQFEADRKAMYGTARQWAEMQADRSIIVDLRQTLENGIKARSETTLKPGDDGYDQICQCHKLIQPGDCSTIRKKLVDGNWVDQDGAG